MNPLLSFYSGDSPDSEGRLFDEIISKDNHWFEVTHNYVQWLFPLYEPSTVNPFAPTLDNEVVAAFQKSELLQKNLLKSFYRMLNFYGLIWCDEMVVKGPNWTKRKSNWITGDTHNNLRITRMLKSLRALGPPVYAEQFLAGLEKLRSSEPDWGIGDLSCNYWRSAVKDL